MPNSLRLLSNAASTLPSRMSVTASLVVTNTSLRSTPLSRMPCPTASSFSYSAAVSMWRYPASSAHLTQLTPSWSLQRNTPRPSIGISTPLFSFFVVVRFMVKSSKKKLCQRSKTNAERQKIDIYIYYYSQCLSSFARQFAGNERNCPQWAPDGCRWRTLDSCTDIHCVLE